MNYKQIIGVFSRKTQLKNVENVRLNDGKIEINFYNRLSEAFLKDVSALNSVPAADMPGTGTMSASEPSPACSAANRKKRHCSGPKYWPRAPVPKP